MSLKNDKKQQQQLYLWPIFSRAFHTIFFCCVNVSPIVKGVNKKQVRTELWREDHRE